MDEFHIVYLDSKRRAWKVGNVTALYDAVNRCKEFDLKTPKWILGAFLGLLEYAYKPRPKKPGRAVGTIPRHRQDMIDFERADMAERVREHFELTWDQAYERASEELRGSGAQGSAGAIERSCKVVRKLSKDPKQALRYHMGNSRLIDILLDRKTK